MTKRDEQLELKVESVMRRYLIRLAAVCVTATSAILTAIYNIGAWGYNNIEAISAAWRAFRGIK